MAKAPRGYVSPYAFLYAPRPEVCEVDGCDRPTTTSVYCAGHYSRWRRTGDPGPAAIRPYRRKDSPKEHPHA